MNELEMETVIDLPNFPNICRICLGTESLQLFSEDYLMDVFKTITSIEVENDGFPLYICKVCLQKLEEINDFGDMARYNNTEYKKTWKRRTKLKEDQILNERKDAALLNNHSPMREDPLPNNNSETTTKAMLLNIYSEKKNDAVLIDTDSDMTNDAVTSNNRIEPTIKEEIFNMDSDIIKEEVLLDTDSELKINSALSNNHREPTVREELSNSYSVRINEGKLFNAHSQMNSTLLSNHSEASIKLELSKIDNDTTSEVVLLNSHSEVTNEVILMNKQGSTTQSASFFSSLYDSTCSNSMDQNSGVVTITDTESEPESRDISFVSHLQVGNFREGPDKQQNPDRNRKPRHRHVYSRNEILELEKEFVLDPFTSGHRRAEIAASLGISEVQVKVWFQNRRMKQRKEDEKFKRINHEDWKKQMILDRLQGMEQRNFNAF